MHYKDFDDFVKNQQPPPASPVFDSEEERTWWLDHLDQLYASIESFLRDYVAKGQIKLNYSPLALHEEYIGTYQTKQMELAIGRSLVLLVPVGTFLIGARGRVDVTGPAKRRHLLLVDKSASNPASLIKVEVSVGGKPLSPTGKEDAPNKRPVEFSWKIVTSPPRRQFIELTKESFFDLMMEVANG